jgi:hypothetical protein
MIVAELLSEQDADNRSEVAPLLDRIDGRIAQVMAQHDRHLAMIEVHGRMSWQRCSGYN